MDSRYERFNERLFESYCKTAIDNAILKESMKKAARYKLEHSLSELTDTILLSFTEDDFEIEQENVFQTFDVQGVIIPVFNPKLAQAISYLLPKDREIILRYYFLGMKDEEIAVETGMTFPTVNRRRNLAKQKIRNYMENMK